MSKDQLTRFMLGNGEVRGQIVRLEGAWQAVASRHPGQPALACLGELCAAANLLAASLKFDGNLVLQIHGDGPIKLMVVECRPHGQFRATLKTAAGVEIAEGTDLAQLVNVHGRGRFVVTLEPSKTSQNQQPYQGIVPFEGTGVAGVLENYMQRSEQVPSRMYLAADEHCAVGLLLQKMPDQGGKQVAPETADRAGQQARDDAAHDPAAGLEQDPDGWPRIQMLADTLKQQELLADTPETLLHKLFWQEKLQVLDQRNLSFSCTCSRDKVAAMLRMLGREEVESILAEQGEIKTQCDYCNKAYRFDAVDAATVFLEGVIPAAAGKA